MYHSATPLTTGTHQFVNVLPTVAFKPGQVAMDGEHLLHSGGGSKRLARAPVQHSLGACKLHLQGKSDGPLMC
jgi:hypothetical protein